jgi:lysophospholipase L1-like esterase
MGDSLTEGYNIDKKGCWASLLREREGWDVTNAGISGDMTAGMLARLPLALDKKKYTHVFIMGGTNDVEFGLSPNLIISNIKSIMRQLRYRDIQYVVGIPMPFNDMNSNMTCFKYVGSGSKYRKRMDEYCEELKCFLKEDGTDFIDFRECFTGENGGILSELFLTDGVHPNEKGHELICNRVVDYYLNI